MNPISPSVGAPAQPQVSLIPPEFGFRRQRARLRVISFLVLIVAGGIVLVGWFFSLGVHTVAESRLTTEQENRAELSTEIAAYDYVTTARTRHDTAMAAQAWAGATDVLWDDYLAAIAGVLPEGVELTQIQTTQATPLTGFDLTSGTPFGQTDLGQITLTGSAIAPELVAELITRISNLSGFAEASMGSVRIEQVVDSEQPMWVFDVSARITLNALSGRLVIPADGSSGASDGSDTEGEAAE